jgi:RNA polymerase sigma-70 factor (ECF subfamily)
MGSPDENGQIARNEQKAIRAVLAGDVEAYRSLVLRHTAMVFRVAFRITANPSDADEVVQEAFLRAYQKLPSFQSQATFATWVYRIAVNCAFDLVSRRERQPSFRDIHDAGQEPIPDHPDPAAGPEQQLLSRELGAQQQHALHALTALERTAFLLRHIEDQSTTEIAAALNLAPNAAKQAVFRAVQKLRQRLAPLREKR